MKTAKSADPVPTRNLTETYLESVKPPISGRLSLRDGNPPGFGVSVTANGVKSYVLDYRIFKRKHRITLGRWPDMTLKEAREEAVAAQRDVRQNHDPLLTRNQSRELRTMHDLASEYLEKHAERYKRPRSVAGDRAMLTMIRARIGDHAVVGISKEHIKKLHADLAATPYRANRVLALLSKMFNLAVEWNTTNKVWRADNPALGVKKYDEEKRERWLNEKEIGQLLTVLDKYPEQNYANAIRLILLTGSRKSEVLQAKWEHIDFENRLWRKPSAHTKQKKQEFVPLSIDAVKVLERMKKTAKPGGEYLFPGRIAGRPLEDLKIHW